MKNITPYLSLVFIALFIFSLTISDAATINSVKSGNWYVANTWDCNCVPLSTDDVVIKYLHGITVSDPATINSIIIDSSGTLFISDTSDILTITADFTIAYGANCSIGGEIHVGNNLTNNGTLSGSNTGTICVANISTNTGALVGTLDFCDATPPTSSPPIDNNSGTVNGSVTFCTTGLCSLNSMAQAELLFSMDIYPNPAHDFAVVNIESALSQSLTLVVYDILGQEVNRVSGNSNEQIVIERNQLSNGLYFISVQHKDQIIGTAKLLLE